MASRQVLADNAQLSSLLASVLSIDVVAKYENLLLNGNGTTDKIEGLVGQASIFSHTAGPKADRLSEAIADMWTNGFVASAIVLHPNDWSFFERERADAGDGQYIAGGGWANPAAPSMWRVPVARAASLAEGNALVLDTRFVTMLDRQQVSTAVSTEDRDNFIKNLVTMLAEMRGGLAVYNTGALRLIDLEST
jgi:HK97 family phage major capsid protein